MLSKILQVSVAVNTNRPLLFKRMACRDVFLLRTQADKLNDIDATR